MPLLIALVLFLVPLAAEAQSPARTVYVVRHAEKVDASRDPQLSDRGMTRARALAASLKDAGLDAVFVTQFVRTGETARPSAEAEGLTPEVITAGGGAVKDHALAVARAVRARPAGEAVLVVGHSNTVPAIVAALGGPEMGEICDAQYANLFVLTVPDSGATSTARLTFGEPDPDDPSCGSMTPDG